MRKPSTSALRRRRQLNDGQLTEQGDRNGTQTGEVMSRLLSNWDSERRRPYVIRRYTDPHYPMSRRELHRHRWLCPSYVHSYPRRENTAGPTILQRK